MTPTFSTDVLVLRKTKLGESDLIVTFLAQDGSQIRAVAKGARKPKSQFASRLELYSQARVLFAKGRNLDIVKEVQLLAGRDEIRQNLELTTTASVMVELLDKITQVNLQHPHLYDMTAKALSCLVEAQEKPSHALILTGAHLLKSFAFVGFRPALQECVSCGEPYNLRKTSGTVRVSFIEGGVVCSPCATSSAGVQTQIRSVNELLWVDSLLRLTFDEIMRLEVTHAEGLSVLRFCQEWARVHAGCNLKSIHFLFTSNLFPL